MKYIQVLSAPCALAAAVMLVAQAALAQTAGTYTGTNNEGDGVQVVVTETSGTFEITGIGDGGTVYCKKAGTSYGYGVGFNGSLATVTAGKATYDGFFSNVFINSSFKFSGSKVTGKMQFGVPILDSKKAAEACPTKPQTFTATLSAPAAPMARGAYAWPTYSK